MISLVSNKHFNNGNAIRFEMYIESINMYQVALRAHNVSSLSGIVGLSSIKMLVYGSVS